MKNTVFEYVDYKKYLTDYLKKSGVKGYGARSRLAETLNCNVAYVSQVLNRSANFSLEQGEEINRFLGHNKLESQFFLLLLQHARAGTEKLRLRIEEQIDEILERRLLLKERVDIKKTLSPLDQTQYYSAWFYAAIHIIVTIPDFQTKDALCKKLGLSLERVTLVLDFLINIGLVIQEQGKFKAGVNRLFLGSDSLMITKHHTNWRMRAIESLDREGADDLHLSTLFTFTKTDFHKIRESLVKSIDGARGIVRETKSEEDIACFNLDFFRL